MFDVKKKNKKMQSSIIIMVGQASSFSQADPKRTKYHELFTITHLLAKPETESELQHIRLFTGVMTTVLAVDEVEVDVHVTLWTKWRWMST